MVFPQKLKNRINYGPAISLLGHLSEEEGNTMNICNSRVWSILCDSQDVETSAQQKHNG